LEILASRLYRHSHGSDSLRHCFDLNFVFEAAASLELELIALPILRQQRPGRPQLSSLDRLL
jgi:hypothetical protein